MNFGEGLILVLILIGFYIMCPFILDDIETQGRINSLKKDIVCSEHVGGSVSSLDPHTSGSGGIYISEEEKQQISKDCIKA